MREHNYYIYIMTNRYHTTLYIGVTSQLEQRVWEHKHKVIAGSFTSRYNLNKLVFIEHYRDINHAISREKQLKGGSRSQKVRLIQETNPGWRDLGVDLGIK